ncbi:hypothetical protein H9655_13850 [Cytobacillus sp. Sa5YUA1]|uniref:Uncharacterized protein n=1 Tax=Cytobacillus stercorigallinarum TaxID=2762240 RepID=A0ABR8QRQ7_9BACI|nr:hypothetical protein [Cytobacillus stercorigallinarum]MBD7938112.1 hypothetical protein [Cytobacillus stercorigallinarum]
MIYPISTVQTAYQQYVERMFMNRNRSMTYRNIERVEPYRGQTEFNRLYKDNRKNHLSSSLKEREINGKQGIEGRYIDYYV